MGFRQVHADSGLGSVSGVVSSLPAGYALGEERMEQGADGGQKYYKLVYNAGNSEIGKGYFAKPAGSSGPYSMTVSMATKTNAHIGAVLCENATSTTGTYFWGMVRGRSDSGVVAEVNSIATGNAIFIATDGTVNLFPQSAVTGNIAIGINLGGAASKTITTGALSGDVYISLM